MRAHTAPSFTVDITVGSGQPLTADEKPPPRPTPLSSPTDPCTKLPGREARPKTHHPLPVFFPHAPNSHTAFPLQHLPSPSASEPKNSWTALSTSRLPGSVVHFAPRLHRRLSRASFPTPRSAAEIAPQSEPHPAAALKMKVTFKVCRDSGRPPSGLCSFIGVFADRGSFFSSRISSKTSLRSMSSPPTWYASFLILPASRPLLRRRPYPIARATSTGRGPSGGRPRLQAFV